MRIKKSCPINKSEIYIGHYNRKPQLIYEEGSFYIRLLSFEPDTITINKPHIIEDSYLTYKTIYQ